jgi:NAD(P)H-dependent FMN reductase
VSELPAFNPDLDDDVLPLPTPVADLRRMLAAADALLISSPEYAHGVPGALKNALDWLVSGPEMVEKPVGLLNASSASAFAHPQLLETLRTMSAHVVAEASITVDIPRRGATAESLARDPAIATRIRGVVDALMRASLRPETHA